MEKIYIDPGHSKSDPGAVGYEVERDLNEKVSAFQKEHLLANYECEVKVGDISLNLNQVIAEANAWGASFLCSNHMNAGKGDGYETLVYSEKRRELGEIFEKHVVAAGQNSRGVKLRPDLGVLRLSNMPAILNEGAFVDNLKDIQDWNEDHELKKLGIAYAEATAEYLELPRKSVTPEEPAEDTYTLDQFIRDVQTATGAEVDGIAGPETLSKTVTVSRYENDTHPVVEAVQKRLASLGYAEVGEADGEAGELFEAAVKHFQADNDCVEDGEITAKNKTWKKLLGVS